MRRSTVLSLSPYVGFRGHAFDNFIWPHTIYSQQTHYMHTRACTHTNRNNPISMETTWTYAHPLWNTVFLCIFHITCSVSVCNKSGMRGVYGVFWLVSFIEMLSVHVHCKVLVCGVYSVFVCGVYVCASLYGVTKVYPKVCVCILVCMRVYVYM